MTTTPVAPPGPSATSMTARVTRIAGWTTAAVGAIALVVGLANPAAALRAMFVVALAATASVLASALAQFLERVPPAASSVIEHARRPLPRPDPDLPVHLMSLSPAMGSEGSALISPGAISALRTIATERLWQRHHLNLWHEAHRQRIADLLSPALWQLIDPRRLPSAPLPSWHFLGRYLDELEQL